jgi:hypothetical protein
MVEHSRMVAPASATGQAARVCEDVAMNDAQTPTGSVPRRVILLIVFGSLLPFLAGGVILWMTLGGGAEEQTFPIVDNYLDAPQTVAERIKPISDEVRRVEISRTLEIYDATGQRYSIGANGTHLRRGGVDRNVPTETFRVDDVDFGSLPAILEAANERSGGHATTAQLEYVDGALTWRVFVWSEGGSNELLYDLDGELRRKSNARQ